MEEIEYKTIECTINMMLTELFVLLQDSDCFLPLSKLETIANFKSINGNTSKGIIHYALLRNNVIGMVMYPKPVYAKTVEIGMVAVSKKYRRIGIGTKLFLLAASSITKCNCDSVFLKCLTENKVGINFYQELGGYIESTDTSVWTGKKEHIIKFKLEK